jgi:hypothetical protein
MIAGSGFVLGEHPPGLLVVAGLGVEEPALDVLARGARVVARWQAVHVLRPIGAPRAGAVGEAGADVERDREGLVHGHLESFSKP